MKRSLFEITQFIKYIPKGGKLNGIAINKSTQKDMVTDEFGVPNYVLRVLFRSHNKTFLLMN